jgi:hypothetical protein
MTEKLQGKLPPFSGLLMIIVHTVTVLDENGVFCHC